MYLGAFQDDNTYRVTYYVSRTVLNNLRYWYVTDMLLCFFPLLINRIASPKFKISLYSLRICSFSRGNYIRH